MVQDTRTAASPDTIQLRDESLRQVNKPEPANVRENDGEQPLAIRLGRWQNVASIVDTWRIDDEWWREEPISRLYYEVLTAQGRRVTIFKDLLHSAWYKQNYV